MRRPLSLAVDERLLDEIGLLVGSVPGTSCALRQTQAVSSTTSAWVWPGWNLAKYPPATQFPAEAQDTDLMPAFPPWFRVALPGISIAVPHGLPVPAIALPLTSPPSGPAPLPAPERGPASVPRHASSKAWNEARRRGIPRRHYPWLSTKSWTWSEPSVWRAANWPWSSPFQLRVRWP
jgi:hypothetical protein